MHTSHVLRLDLELEIRGSNVQRGEEHNKMNIE
jgi:hypothetical protein